jgi:virulence-associated protein VagC
MRIPAEFQLDMGRASISRNGCGDQVIDPLRAERGGALLDARQRRLSAPHLRRRALHPQDGFSIKRHGGVMRQKPQGLDACLRDQETIERVLVMWRQRRHGRRMGRCDRQHALASLVEVAQRLDP